MQGMASAARALADNVIYLKDAAAIVAAVIAGKLTTAMLGAAGASNLAAIATVRLSLALVVLNLRLGAAAIAARGFAAVLAFFGGPIGLAIAAIGATFLIVANHEGKAKEKALEYAEALKQINNIGKSVAETSRQMVIEQLEHNKAIVEAERAELKLAIAQKQRQLGLVVKGSFGGKQIAAEMAELEVKLAAT